MAIYRLLRNTPLAETGHLIAAYELTLVLLIWWIATIR